ncbi:hypothetical protein GX48_05865 [Paracoccidioides brasiliensis]|nr:hypothetical protein GX48_05865 [Paracoccidioides brasiliensis]
MHKFLGKFPSLKLNLTRNQQKLQKSPKSQSMYHPNRKKGTNSGSNNQSPFPFLSLPPEIRNQIYYTLFNCDLAIHLFHLKDKLYLVRCSQSTPHVDHACCQHSALVDRRLQELSYTYAQALQYGNTNKPIAGTPQFFLTRLPTAILYTNKQLYNEASAMLYSEMSFEAAELTTWLLFARMVSARHLALVKRLRSTWVGLPCLTMAPVRPGGAGYAEYEQYTLWDEPYEEFWELVKEKMEGLVELGFCMNYEGQYLDRSTGAKWLKPLLEVRRLNKVEVWVRDRIGGEDGKGGENVVAAKREGEVLMQYLRGIMCQGRKEGWE